MVGKRLWILAVLFCMAITSASAQYYKTDSLHYDHSGLNSGGDTSLYVRDSSPASSNCNYDIKKASLYLYLHLGEVYKYGDASFSSIVNVVVRAYSSYSGTSGQVAIYKASLKINEDAPEQYYLIDFTDQHDVINRFEIDIFGYTDDAVIHDSIKLAVFFKEDFGVDVTGTSLTNQVVTPANPTNFVWSNDCDDIPNYEFQLLRLFNNDQTKTTESIIQFVVDWSEALTIETGSNDTSLELTLADGRGYYIWRVRPIGTEYEGGIANWRNWGSWSTTTYSDGVQYTISVKTATADKFFYYQFDDTLNWIYSRTFSEGDPVSPAVKISERMTYANGLQQVRQNLAHLQTEDEVLVSQTVMDWSGRPALTTMAAPDTEDSLGYRSGFIKTAGGNLYTAEYFDQDDNYNDPQVIGTGILVDYYSNANADTTVPNAEGYPYSRALYDRDGTGRVREQGGPGGTHRIKTASDHTPKTYYSGVSDKELVRVFGDEAPEAASVHKTINIDPNKTVTVTYNSKEGQTIATCLAIGPDNDDLDTLDSQMSFAVFDTLSKNTRYGDYGLTSNAPVSFVIPTTLNIYYSITSKEVEHLCANYCSECDYSVDIMIHGDTTTYSWSFLIVDSCNATSDTNISVSQSLAAGSWVVEKRVYANNLDTTSGTDTTVTPTFLKVHLDALDTLLQSRADDSLSTIVGYLKSSSMNLLYNYLGIDTAASNPDSLFADSTVWVNIGCDSIEIPILFCSTDDCPDADPDFEGYFADRWDGTAFEVETVGGFLNYLNVAPYNYQPTQFNNLVANMIADGYDCEALWECWKRITMTYANMDSIADTSVVIHNILIDFLDCTGRKFKGYSTDTAYYRGAAYAYFNYTYGNSAECDSALTTTHGDTATWGQDTLEGQLTWKKWELYYNCTRFFDSEADTSFEHANANAACNCLGACENRYESFRLALISMYHNDSMYVEGDIYELVADTIWGQIYGWGIDSISSGFSDYVPLDEIYCAATSLVEHCKTGCDLTIYQTGGVVDSVGSPAERLAMEQSMTWTYNLSRLACSVGYDTIQPPSSSDTTLSKIWDQQYGGDSLEMLWGMAEIEKGCGGYVLGGWTTSSDTNDIADTIKGSRDYWVVRVNDNGDILWESNIGGTLKDMMYDIIETSDGGFLLGGYSLSDITGDKTDTARWDSRDYWLVKLDPFGNLEWDKTYGGDDTDIMTSVIETSDHYYVMAGMSASGNTGEKSQATRGETDYWIVKVDTEGNKIWDKRFGSANFELLSEIIEMDDGNYLLAGSSDGDNSGDKTQDTRGLSDMWIVKIDTAGTKIWDKRYGTDSIDGCFAVVQAADGDLILAGFSDECTSCGDKNAVGFGETDYWVLKVNDDTPTNDTIRWDSVYGGSGFDGLDNKSDNFDLWMDIASTPDGGYVIGSISSSPKNTGNKTDTLYTSPSAQLDYWVVKIESDGTKEWDKTYGGTLFDFCTTIDVDDMGYYWIGGYTNSDDTGDKTDKNYDNTLNSGDFWVIKAKEYCTHDSICFSWDQRPILDTDSTFVEIIPISCDSIAAGAIYNSILSQVGAYIDTQKTIFANAYSLTCTNPDSIVDTMVISYGLGYHHYTLYYYDRAGNLVRTVPPLGVDTSVANRNTHPSHTYITEYEYNSLKQLTKQYTPDGDSTRFWYGLNGQLRFSRNAQQKVDSAFSYTKYDALGRIVEVGQSSEDFTSFFDSVEVADYPDTATQRTYTVYTTSGGIEYLDGTGQQYLQNRVSYTYTEDSIVTYFSYDPHGNVEWLIQYIPGLGYKFLRYEYDLISNNVLAVHYNEGAAEESHHRYRYDADQRIRTAETAWGKAADLDEVIGWDKDATYSYYKHGPLKRVELGDDRVQGIDYVYTLQGWLKGINHPSLDKDDDPGRATDNNSTFGQDKFGMVLGYHANDFNRDGSPYNPITSTLISSETSSIKNLYNGNISNWTLKRDSVNASITNDRKGLIYTYDQLNRITLEDYWKFTEYVSVSWTNTSDFNSSFGYDANGNITSLARNASGGTYTMDRLTYNYIPGNTNKLEYVTDAVAAGNQTVDIDDQSAHNYRYDKIGNLTSDQQEGIDSIHWTVYGKVQKVVKSSGDSLEYVYDAAGNKIEQRAYVSGVPMNTYYIRDASGNIMSTYRRETAGSEYVYTQLETNIFGSDRLGMYKTGIEVHRVDTSGPGVSCFGCTINNWTINIPNHNNYFTRTIDSKEYELKDHLGNVRVVVSDQKNSSGEAIVLNYNNYYAFGMKRPGAGQNYRLMTGLDNGTGYRYGYNGKEQDFSFHNADGEVFDYGFRIYDSRLGRFLSVDPLFNSYPWYTPYQFAGNMPISAIDLDGLEEYYFMYDFREKSKGPHVVYSYTIWEKLNEATGKVEKINGKRWFMYNEMFGGDVHFYEFDTPEELAQYDRRTLKGFFTFPDNFPSRKQVVDFVIDASIEISDNKELKEKLKTGDMALDVLWAMDYSDRAAKLQYSVIAGSFKVKANAENFANEISDNYKNAYVMKVTEEGFYRVSVGDFSYKEKGKALRARNESRTQTKTKAWLLLTNKKKAND